MEMDEDLLPDLTPGELRQLEGEVDAHNAEREARHSCVVGGRRIWPKGNYLVLRKTKEEERTAGGLLLPKSQENQRQVVEAIPYEVAAISPDKVTLSDGTRVSRRTDIEIGTLVIAMHVLETHANGDPYFLVEEPDIMAVAENVAAAAPKVEPALSLVTPAEA